MSTSDLIARLTEMRLKESEILRSRNFELRRLEEECAQKDADILRLRTIESDLQAQMSSLKSDHQSSTEQRHIFEREIAALKEEITKNELRIQAIHEDYARKLARITDKAWAKDLELEALKGEQSKTQAEIATLTQMKSETENRIQDIQQRLAEARSEVTLLRAELKSANDNVRNSEIQARSEAQLASHAILQATREREDYVRNLEREIASLQGQLHTLKSDREQAQASIETRTETVKELESQIVQLRHALGSIRSEHAAEIQSLIEENRIFVAKLKDKHRENTAKLQADFEVEKSTMILDFSEEKAILAERHEDEIDKLVAEHGARYEDFKRVEQQMKADIVRLQAIKAGQETQITFLSKNNDELKIALENLQRSNDRLREETKALEDIVRKLESDAEKAFARLSDAHDECARERVNREKVESRLDEAIVKNSELVGQIASLHEQVSDKTAVTRALEIEVTNTRSLFEKTEELLHTTKKELALAMSSIATMQKTYEDQVRETERIHKNEIKEEQLKRQTEAFAWSTRFNDQAQVLSQLKSKMEAEIEEKRSLQDAASKELEVQREQVASLSTRLLATEKRLQSTQSEYENYREKSVRKHEDLEERYSALRLESARQLKDAQIAYARTLRTEKTRREEELSAMRREFESLAAKEQAEHSMALDRARQELMARLETERASQSVELADLEKRVEDLSRENANLKLAMNSKTSGLEAEQREFEVRSQHRERQIAAREKQASIREMQLKQYANSITEQKTEFVRQTKILADEVGTASKMHPLKDYLKMTEFELSRVEVQLKLTPTISSDRAKLESYFEKMVEQRDFLTKVVAESEKKFAEQAQKLLELIRSPKMAATPPPPPVFAPKVEPAPMKELLSDSPVFEN